MIKKEIFQSFSIDPYLFYDALTNSTDDYIYIVNMSNDTSLVSENMYHDFDLPGLLVEGLIPLWGNLIHERDQKRYYKSIETMMNGDTDEHNVEYQIRNRSNEYIWVVCRGLLKRDENGVPLMFAGIVTNLGSRGKIDNITGLFTETSCKGKVDTLIENQEEGGILLLGLDDFSHINKLNDHIFGDAVLRQFAQTVQSLLPIQAEMYRFDGDSFAIVYTDADTDMILDLYEKIHAYCNRQHEVDDISYFCTVSGGIAMIGKDGDNYLDLIKFASSALEASKYKGKNMCTLFSQELIQEKMRQLSIADQLQNSLISGMEGFYLVYQPLTDARTMKVNGAEALLRWQNSHCPNVGPDEFIPILETMGLINQVGRWVIQNAARTCREWLKYNPDFVMNINISYIQILDDQLIPFIKSTLDEIGLDSKHIVIELTESCFVTEMNSLAETFRQLRELNIRLAMDDFGTGYSSLGMLAQSPADIVKIDRLFISSIHVNSFNRSFINAVIQLCHSVGITVCVEGVEQKEELSAVLDINADTIQGFYISRPILPDEFKSLYLIKQD
ncbi:GGDEF and EAL domain-containing protein [Murimonas intestini]|uniref:Diguanylate cyclase (GGDEF)-like protein n=1 Tax=Murimonas intestini TaxID=1337051 RepID=A0AB73T3C3_9FIRM|nr:GGDEF and EAL domain-containing protein [Murimonas intestini]MCR1841723.1 GGDEF and EAL domain-containing protein [Murimonas intestini]MCR1865540.1 GGDEF and EAL domain-containing protein [Murimonas intestini]MCR1883879.1 GGDEF and EAL domain-containing protein [Murimonas intestini]